MADRREYLFSASKLEDLNLYKSLEVKSDISVVARGIKLFQGDKLVHNVRDPSLESVVEGTVFYIKGKEHIINKWFYHWDKYYGKKAEEMVFYFLNKRGTIHAPIYLLENFRDIGYKDGRLSLIKSKGSLKTFMIDGKEVYACVSGEKYSDFGPWHLEIAFSREHEFPFGEEASTITAKSIDVSNEDIKKIITENLR